MHVPFCSAVCPYCDFAVLIAGDERRQGYLEAVAREAALYTDLDWRFDTVYFGGGTPSSLATAQIGEILEATHDRLSIEPGAGHTIEVNPEDVTGAAARQWRGLGFDTVSVGAQAFSDQALEFLGRRHTAGEARAAVAELREAGYRTVSVDLIYGLPGQTAEGWRRQLEEAVALAPDHLSCYQLTLHDGTSFGRRRRRGQLQEAPEELQAELFMLTHAVLADVGYEGYEVSNFARSREHRSSHNLKYWRHTPYLGLGPSAHSFDGARRWWNRRKLRLWQRDLSSGQAPVEGMESLTAQQLALETVLLGLRTADGIDLDRLRACWGVDLLAGNREPIARLIDGGQLVLEGSTLRPTVLGMAIADTLARSLDVEAAGAIAQFQTVCETPRRHDAKKTLS